MDAASDSILGAAILATRRVIQLLGTLMLGSLPYTLLKDAIFIHPTLAEGSSH
jgi:pyruvate/2-oxoglutarate dehydrogenase complex dihydrolipoamide dehydrogenase (E3) component